ncbi:hypothetical protein VCHE16_2071 [Vibrio paracholerae HE-16]|nr:hypothetical protein VCHE16_2071 [Vibrio paracholerae HE-16]
MTLKCNDPFFIFFNDTGYPDENITIADVRDIYAVSRC